MMKKLHHAIMRTQQEHKLYEGWEASRCVRGGVWPGKGRGPDDAPADGESESSTRSLLSRRIPAVVRTRMVMPYALLLGKGRL